MPVRMANKKNGKLVVIGVLLFVLALSGIAWVAQQFINANKGKPPSQPAEAPAQADG